MKRKEKNIPGRGTWMTTKNVLNTESSTWDSGSVGANDPEEAGQAAQLLLCECSPLYPDVERVQSKVLALP